ncbi:MAG: NERD domain-containing protein [Thermoanaerobacteraceae bacterium]|nr:NERD domain-containing protein [Thermoanaerobacteraceae bacterium]
MFIFAIVISFICIVAIIFLFSHSSKKGQAMQGSQRSKTKSASPKPTQPPNKNQDHIRKAHRKGELGEYKINIQLKRLPKDYKHLSDLLIKTDHGLTQIDHVIISPAGIFVVETKNYSGAIYGKQYDKTWTQVYNNRKQPFYNPIRQNYGHIQSLKAILKGYSQVEFHSVISFTRRCKLKVDWDLRTTKSPIMVIYDTELTDSILKRANFILARNAKPNISSEDIAKIFDILSSANIKDENIREQHISEIKRKGSI